MATMSVKGMMAKVDYSWRITLFTDGVEMEHYDYASEADAALHLKNARRAVEKLKTEGLVSRVTTHRTRVQEA
jgi:hypothetical protein